MILNFFREGAREEEGLGGGKVNWRAETKAAPVENLQLISLVLVLRWIATTFRHEKYPGELESRLTQFSSKNLDKETDRELSVRTGAKIDLRSLLKTSIRRLVVAFYSASMITLCPQCGNATVGHLIYSPFNYSDLPGANAQLSRPFRQVIVLNITSRRKLQ